MTRYPGWPARSQQARTEPHPTGARPRRYITRAIRPGLAALVGFAGVLLLATCSGSGAADGGQKSTAATTTFANGLSLEMHYDPG